MASLFGFAPPGLVEEYIPVLAEVAPTLAATVDACFDTAKGHIQASDALLALLLLPYAYIFLKVILSPPLAAFGIWRRSGIGGLYKRVAGAALGALQSFVPGVSSAIQAQVQKELDGIEKDMLGDGDADALVSLPETSTTAGDVAERVSILYHNDPFFQPESKQWGGIYHEPNSELTMLQAQVWAAFNTSNALYPEVFPSLRRFEAEIVSMTLGIVHGHECGAVGLLSSGGTESVLIAALAYRELGRKRGITQPQIICGLSAHPAIVKACAYFNIELVKAPLDPVTMKLTAANVKPLLTSRTVAIYASAPSFSFGCVDEIEALRALAKRSKVGLHVDNCLGGFFLSFMQRAGLYAPKWDFAVEGVTTISIDLHKYGCTSKGASVVAFRDAALRALTFVPSADGCEGLYVTPTLQGSRSGATMAAAWATLVMHGEEYYLDAAKKMTEATEALKVALSKMPKLKVCGNPTLAIVPVCGCDGLNVYALASLLQKKGYGVFTGQKPATVAFPVGERTPRMLDQMILDIRECVDRLISDPSIKPTGTAAVYGSASAVPDEILEEVLRGYIDVKLKVKPNPTPIKAKAA